MISVCIENSSVHKSVYKQGMMDLQQSGEEKRKNLISSTKKTFTLSASTNMDINMFASPILDSTT
jgi:hypothetical protein